MFITLFSSITFNDFYGGIRNMLIYVVHFRLGALHEASSQFQ